MKHASSVFLGVIFLLSMFSSLNSVYRVSAAGQVNILTHSGWLDSIGYYHVSGEVQNTGGNAAEFVKVIATFYDSGNTVVDTSFTYSALSNIPSGRKSPFEILLVYTSQAAKVDHYSLSVTSSSSSPLPLELEILSNSSYLDIIDYMHVVGEIRNTAVGTATFVKIIATYYDIEGHVVATAFTYSDPSDIEPSQTAPFHILLVYTSRVPLVNSYVLTAESNQYSIVPEFPTFLIFPLFMIAALLAVIVYRKNHKDFRGSLEVFHRSFEIPNTEKRERYFNLFSMFSSVFVPVVLVLSILCFLVL